MSAGSNQLLLDGLQRAAAAPEGLPLFGGKKGAGLFSPSAPARKAAQLVMDDGLIRVLRTENKGRSTQEICAITEKGLQLLLEQANPRTVLDALVQALEARRLQLAELVESARRAESQLEALRHTVEKTIQHLHQRPAAPTLNGNGHVADGASVGIQMTIIDQLGSWQASGALEDYPLPQLYRTAIASGLSLTVGQFHDALRRLQEGGKVYLHPWTGPMYQIPEPPFALMVGHEIAYYASLRPS
jgi:hypothetical protein